MFPRPLHWPVALIAAAVPLLGLLVGMPATADADERTDHVYRVAIRATAFIVTETSWGTGVLIDGERRLLVTNYHVVPKAEKASVIFPVLEDGRPTGD